MKYGCFFKISRGSSSSSNSISSFANYVVMLNSSRGGSSIGDMEKMSFFACTRNQYFTYLYYYNLG